MPASSSDPAAMARALLRKSRQGALATLMVETGAPYCSLVNVAPDSDGAPILLVSALALHTKNIVADPRVSLMLDERKAGDPLEGARVMLAGVAGKVSPKNADRIKRRYLAFHPSAEMFVNFPDFSFLRIEPEGVHLVAGFGRIVDFAPSEFLTDIRAATSLIAAEPEIVAHMNADHRDTMNLYATRLLGAPAGDWHCVACDPDGIDLAVAGASARLTFPRRVTEPSAIRNVLKELAAAARAV